MVQSSFGSSALGNAVTSAHPDESHIIHIDCDTDFLSFQNTLKFPKVLLCVVGKSELALSLRESSFAVLPL